MIATPQRIEGTHRRRPLTAVECALLLREVGWGILAVVEREGDSAVPVGVPTAYAYDGERIYIAMAEGRKLRALERNPHLCLTVTNVRSRDEWRSVAVIGRACWITDEPERAAAIAAFLIQPRRDGRLGHDDVTRLDHGRLLTVDVNELNGYARVVARAQATATDDAADAMNSLRRVVRGLRLADAESEAALGVTTAQLFVLREIDRSRVLTVSELSQRTATTQSSVSEVVARLDARGLIARTRSNTDRRRAEISLSEAGRALLARAPETVQERLLSALERLSPCRRRQAAQGLRAWIYEAGLADVAATMFFEPLANR